MHKIKPGIHLCELHVTMYLHRTARSLSDVESHFFPYQKNSCSCSMLNVCTFVQQYISTNVRLSKGTDVGRLRESGLIYCQKVSVHLLEKLCPATSFNTNFRTS